MGSYRIDFEALPWEIPIEGVRHKVLRQGNRRLRLVEYSAAMPLHWCDAGHIGYMLQGEIEIQFEHEKVTFASGDGVFIPAGHEHRHQARVRSGTATIVFVEDC
jgi:quercetin dioxygenase-like cupin family protein